MLVLMQAPSSPGYELCPTRRPVVTISSPMEDREDEDGCEAISTHDSDLH